MKPNTVKQPTKPRIDYSQGQNLLVKILERIFSSGSNLVEEVRISRHTNQKRYQNSGNFIRKTQAKKKRLRKISYQSRRNNRLFNCKKIKI